MTSTARIFRNGRSQTVRLPKEYRFEGESVKIRRLGRGVILEPVEDDVDAWFKSLDAFAKEPFMQDGRHQPKMPVRNIF